MVDAGSAAALEGKIDRLSSAMRATFDVMREICRLHDLDELLMLVSEKSRELLGCELAGFALLDESGETIAWRAMTGCATDVYRRFTFRRDGGIAGRAITTGFPVIVRDFFGDPSIDPREFPISFAEGLRSVVGVPLAIAGTPRGCLMVGHRTVHEFSADEVDLLASFAAQAAIAIETAELYVRLRRERARFESIVESVNEGIVLVDLAGRIGYVNARASSLFRVDFDQCLDADTFLDRFLGQIADEAGARRALAMIGDDVSHFPSFDVVPADDSQTTVRITVFGVYGDGGVRFGRGYLARDVSVERHIDAMKTEVISIVSHELRTPLAAIRGCASALLDGKRKRDANIRREYLRTIDSESARLDALVANLLDVSKLDAGVLEIEHYPYDLSALVEMRIARWHTAEPECRFEVEREPDPFIVELDRVRIEQVLDNLVANALDSGASEVVVSVRTQDGRAVVAVNDNGSGIAPEDLERIFERFHHKNAKNSGSGRAKRQGSGLGLYICRGIVEAHGGRMWVRSTVGAGSTVGFSLTLGANMPGYSRPLPA